MTPRAELFWLETNDCWGWVSTAKDWRNKVLTWTANGITREPKQILEARATLATDAGTTDFPNFGFYSEHRGKTLREWLAVGKFPAWITNVVSELQNSDKML